MHEVGIIQNTLDLALETARSSGARQIHQLRLRVGAMTGVVPEALLFAFDVVRAGTIASDARLEVENVPAACWCAICQSEFHSEDSLYECPRCGAMSSELRHGLELDLVSMEIS
ncbi:MAG: hydrogenase maturation nickel metallochaperone HypA [Verrucomicrobia bacterium]|nr:hydrogenase maturation nickel metallochaperone HypA [Verrucomicrobiota bacterium]